MRPFCCTKGCLSWTQGSCHSTERSVPRCSHIKACTWQRCLNTLILSLHSSPNFNSCRCCRFPHNNCLCNVLHTNPKRGPSCENHSLHLQGGADPAWWWNTVLTHLFEECYIQYINCANIPCTQQPLSTRRCGHAYGMTQGEGASTVHFAETFISIQKGKGRVLTLSE